jgi:hypothetical protein
MDSTVCFVDFGHDLGAVIESLAVDCRDAIKQSFEFDAVKLLGIDGYEGFEFH